MITAIRYVREALDEPIPTNAQLATQVAVVWLGSVIAGAVVVGGIFRLALWALGS